MSMNRIEEKFKNLKARKKKAFIVYITTGDPDIRTTERIIGELDRCGVDILELGVPFSDPIADGPTIQAASERALKNRVSVRSILSLTRRVRKSSDIPIALMTYYNPVYRYGVAAFVKDAKAAGVDGVIVPDLPPEEGQEYLKAMEEHDLAPILIFSPTTPFERMKYLATFARGFIYCVARKGVTGAETEFSEQLAVYLSQCRKATPLPLALGFGITEKGDIDFLKGKADIAIIGTQTIRIIEKEGIAPVGGFIRSLR